MCDDRAGDTEKTRKMTQAEREGERNVALKIKTEVTALRKESRGQDVAFVSS